MRKGTMEEKKKIIILSGVVILLLILILCVVLSIKERKESADTSVLPVLGAEESLVESSMETFIEDSVENTKDAGGQTEEKDIVESTSESAENGQNITQDGVIELPFVPAK